MSKLINYDEFNSIINQNNVDNYNSDFVEFIKLANNKSILDMLYVGYMSLKLTKSIESTKLLDLTQKELKSSYVIGKKGEETIKEIILSKYTLLDVSKTKYSGDCVIFHDNFKIAIESKKYDKKVPTAEITKFKRDVCMNDYHAGILVSLTSDIVKFNNKVNIIYEIVNSVKIPILLITDKDLLLSCIELIITMLKNTHEIITVKTSLEKSLISIENIKHLIEELQLNNVKQFNKINSDINTISNNLRDNIN